MLMPIQRFTKKTARVFGRKNELQLKHVQSWAIIHEVELLENFNNLRSNNPTWKKLNH
jgi:hypothetical protein